MKSLREVLPDVRRALASKSPHRLHLIVPRFHRRDPARRWVLALVFPARDVAWHFRRDPGLQSVNDVDDALGLKGRIERVGEPPDKRLLKFGIFQQRAQ